MRNRILTGAVALACASLVACSTVATLGTDVNTALNELTAVHKTRDQAIASKDVAALARQHEADLKVTLADGTKLDRAGFEALLQVDRHAIASGQGSALRETWKRTGDGWKLKTVQEVSTPSTVAAKS